jgi:hypothetical protein
LLWVLQWASLAGLGLGAVCAAAWLLTAVICAAAPGPAAGRRRGGQREAGAVLRHAEPAAGPP